MQGLLRRLPLIPTPPNNRPFSFAIGKGETLPGPQPVSRLHFPDQMEKTDSAVSAHPAPATLVLLCVFQTSAVLAEAGPSPPACSLSTQAHLLPLKAREAGQWGREEAVRPGLQETLDPHVSKKGHSSGPLTSGRRLRGGLDPQLVSQSENTCRKSRTATTWIQDGTAEPARSPHRVLGTWNFCSGSSPNGPSINPKTAQVSKYQGVAPVAFLLL